MAYYKVVNDGKIVEVGIAGTVPINSTKIDTEAEYNVLLSGIKIHASEVREYISEINAGNITIDDVPETHRSEVESIINQPEPQPSDDYTAGYDQAVLDMIESGVL